jgi:hypothetical protein
MKYIKKIAGVKHFFLLKGEEVIVTAHNLQIGDLTLDAAPDDDVFCENDVLIKREHFKKQFTYKDGKWIEDHPRYGYFQYFSENLYYSRERNKEEQLMRYSIIENGKETLFEIKSELGIMLHSYNERLSMYIFPEILDRSLLFYTKDLQFLWKYQIDELNFKIVAHGVSIVGDTVVIVKREKINMTVFRFFVEAYCIRTGERKWGPKELRYNPSFRVGGDGFIYAMEQDDGGYTFVVRLDPKNGELTEYEIKSELLNPDDRINGHSFIDKNMMYFTSNSPVPTIGVIDLKTMQLLEYQKMETEWEAWTTEDPIVTEDKVYLYVPLANELHVLQK